MHTVERLQQMQGQHILVDKANCQLKIAMQL